MGFSYLGGKNWSEITRDERTFCAYLFHAFKDEPQELINAFQQHSFQIDGFTNDLSISGKKWELGYEVCFYRDLLLNFGIKIKEEASLLEKWGIIKPSKLIKRTFDLCLFSEDEIIIIEAKGAEGLTSTQFIDFQKDFRENIKTLDAFGKSLVKEDSGGAYIQKIFQGLKDEKDPTINIPKVKLIVLASSHYLDSKSFKEDIEGKLGVGGRFILRKREEDRAVHGLMSWDAIFTYMKKNKIGTSIQKYMMKRADIVYLSNQKRPKQEMELLTWYKKELLSS
jgi:hypothetical protein